MAEARQNTNQGNNSNEDNVVKITLPGTDKEVPVKIGKITAAAGCFLAKVVFEEWADAYELERTERAFHRDPKRKDTTVEVSRVTLQTVGNLRVPC